MNCYCFMSGGEYWQLVPRIIKNGLRLRRHGTEFVHQFLNQILRFQQRRFSDGNKVEARRTHPTTQFKINNVLFSRRRFFSSAHMLY